MSKRQAMRRPASTLAKVPPSNLYNLLGVRRTASLQEIDNAYQQLARSLPTKESLQELFNAYELLCDPVTRTRYNNDLVATDSADGREGHRNTTGSKLHPLADFPKELVRVLLECQPSQWSAGLQNMSVSQLNQVIAALGTISEGKVGNRMGRDVGHADHLSLCNLFIEGDGYVVGFQWSGLRLISRYSSCAAVAVFYHSRIMKLRHMLSDVIESNPDCNHEEAVRRAFDDWTGKGFACPVYFQYNLDIGSQPVSLPRVQSLDLALRMRQQALQAGCARAHKMLKTQWAQQVAEYADKRCEIMKRKAAQLIGFALCQKQNQEQLPQTRLRKLGKQPPDRAIQVPLSEGIASQLGESDESLQRRFATASGQETLLRFLLSDIAKDENAPKKDWASRALQELERSTASAAKLRRVQDVPMPVLQDTVAARKCYVSVLPQKTLEEDVAPWLSHADMAACGPACLALKRMVQSRMALLCLTGFSFTAAETWRQVISFLHCPYVQYATKLDFSALPPSPGIDLDLGKALARLELLHTVKISPRHSPAAPAKSCQIIKVELREDR